MVQIVSGGCLGAHGLDGFQDQNHFILGLGWHCSDPAAGHGRVHLSWCHLAPCIMVIKVDASPVLHRNLLPMPLALKNLQWCRLRLYLHKTGICGQLNLPIEVLQGAGVAQLMERRI